MVLDKKVSEVAFGIIKYIRLPLLTPDELTVVEADNKADHLIPVNFWIDNNFYYSLVIKLLV